MQLTKIIRQIEESLKGKTIAAVSVSPAYVLTREDAQEGETWLGNAKNPFNEESEFTRVNISFTDGTTLSLKANHKNVIGWNGGACDIYEHGTISYMESKVVSE